MADAGSAVSSADEAGPLTADSALGLPSPWEWAVVEIFGHRRHVGRAREEERFGAKLLRIDVPIDGDPEKGWRSHWYGGSALFSYGVTTEELVMKANKPRDMTYGLLTGAHSDDDD